MGLVVLFYIEYLDGTYPNPKLNEVSYIAYCYTPSPLVPYTIPHVRDECGVQIYPHRSTPKVS